jgi:methionine-rich copper-binding protein CopC
MKKIAAFILLVAVILLTPRIVSAHASVVACAPHIGANLKQAPTQLICLFDQPLHADKVLLTVIAPNGQRVDKNDARLFENDAYSVIVSLDPAKMTDGIYQVNWQVTDTLDEGQTSGTVQFGVNTVVPPTPTIVLPGQVIVTPSPAQTTASSDGAGELISRFLIGASAVLFIAMGVLFWRTRSGSADASDDEA